MSDSDSDNSSDDKFGLKDKEVTLFICGPKANPCDHKFDRYEPIIQDGREVGETIVCSLCGVSAFEQSMWD